MKGEFIPYENIGQAECGEYIALGDNSKEYSATLANVGKERIMFYCIPSDVKILGYYKVVEWIKVKAWV